MSIIKNEQPEDFKKIYTKLSKAQLWIARVGIIAMLSLEVCVLFAKLLTHTMQMPTFVYILRYILRPGLLAVIGYEIGRYLIKKYQTDYMEKVVPIYYLVFLCAIITYIHYVFPATYGVMIIPIIMSSVYGDKRFVIDTTIVSYLAYLIAQFLTEFDPILNRPAEYMYSVVVGMLLMGISAGCGIMIVNFEQNKEQAWNTQRKMTDLYKEESHTDSLTKLFNYATMKEHVQHLIDTQKVQESFYLVMIDIDHFKQVNDTYGHNFGNVVLQRLSELLHNIHSRDICPARYGGEEFCILITNCSQTCTYEIVNELARKFREQSYREGQLGLTFSAGIAPYNQEKNFESWIQKADEALYYAKEHGRDRIEML